jgi:hypothetical protein
LTTSQHGQIPSCIALFFSLYPMVSPSAKEVFIMGVTHDGRTFRPSDWAERLAGVMSQFRPGGAVPGSHLSYSPWCVPNTLDGQKCVIVHTDLREEEPMAWSFVMNFARDNDLQVIEACLLPEHPPQA